MAFKYVILLVAAVGAASLQDRNRDHPQQQQQRHPAADSQDQRNDDSIGYDFSYSVHDPNTGDVKSQEESRRNGNVRGQYSWVDADGIRQIVEYQADDRNGFNSEHRREPAVRPRPASHVLVPAPLYTIDTVIAPVWTSQSRSDNSRSRSRQDRNRSGRDRDQDRDQEDRDQRNQQRDGQDSDRENQRNEQDNRDDRDSREQRRDEQRRDEQRRDEQRRDDQRRDEQRRDDQRRDDQRRDDQRQRSRDERVRGRESHAQSEVRFQAADVAYQYSN